MTKFEISLNAANIINTIAKGTNTSKAVAEKMNISVAVVTGSLASLKKNNLVTVDNGVMSLTKAGFKYAYPGADKKQPTTASTTISRKLRTGTKAELARSVFDNRGDKTRKVIINELISVAGLSKNGAATYLQNLKRKAGLINSK